MIDFLWGAGIETLELGRAEQEIIQMEKVWDTEQSRQGPKQMQRRMKCSVYLESGRSEVWLEHMAGRGNGRRRCWKSSWGQNVKNVKVHRRSAKGLGIYPAGSGDPAEVFCRAVKQVDLFLRNDFSGIRVADELEWRETSVKT